MNEAKTRWREKALKMVSWLGLHRCPIAGCKYKWRLKDSLGLHLYQKHLKRDLIKVILEEVVK